MLWCLIDNRQTSAAENSDPTRSPPLFDALTFSPNGRLLAAATQAGLYVWDSKSGKRLWRWPKVDSSATTVAFSPDNKWMVACFGQTISVFDAVSGKEMNSFFSSGGTRPYSLAVSPDGKEIVVGEHSGRVSLYSTESWRLEQTWDVKKHVNAFTYSQDGKTLFIGTSNKVLICSRSLREGRIFCEVVAGEIRSLSLSPDGHVLVLANGDGSIHGWSTLHENLVFKIQGHRKSANTALLFRNGEMVSVGGDGYLRVWDVATGKKSFEQFIDPFLWSIASSPDSTVIATGGPTVRLWKAGVWSEILFEGQLWKWNR